MAHQNISVPTEHANQHAQFEAIYRAHSRQITTHIATHLHRTDRYLAEDLTAETFLRFWRSLTGGLNVEHPRALLATIAERTIADHFRRRRSHETATDFTTANATEVPAGNADTPHLAGLLADLETAKEHLAQAADAYKVISRRYAIACAALANAANPESIARAERRKDRASLLVQAALSDFRHAAQGVAQARAEWNQSAVHIAAGADEPLPKRNPGATFRRAAATTARPRTAELAAVGR